MQLFSTPIVILKSRQHLIQEYTCRQDNFTFFVDKVKKLILRKKICIYDQRPLYRKNKFACKNYINILF